MFFSVITKNKRWGEVLRMKNFNFMEVHLKIQFLWGTSRKNNIKGELPKKWGGGGLDSWQI